MWFFMIIHDYSWSFRIIPSHSGLFMMIHDYLRLFIYDTSKTYILFQMTLNSFIHSYIYSTKYLGQKKNVQSESGDWSNLRVSGRFLPCRTHPMRFGRMAGESARAMVLQYTYHKSSHIRPITWYPKTTTRLNGEKISLGHGRAFVLIKSPSIFGVHGSPTDDRSNIGWDSRMD